MKRGKILGYAAALSAISIFISLWPLSKFYIWGSDTGEYLWILRYFSQHGGMPKHYPGWALVYHYYYGLYSPLAPLIQAGADPLNVLKIIIPAISSLSSIFVFLLIYKFTEDEFASFLGGVFYIMALPKIFPLSHPMPGSLADFFMVGFYLLVYLYYEDYKYMALAFILGLGVIITHHFTTYLLLISLFMAALIRSAFFGIDVKVKRDLALAIPLYLIFVLYLVSIPPFVYIFKQGAGVGNRGVLAMGIGCLCTYLIVLYLIRGKLAKYRDRIFKYSKFTREGILKAFGIFSAIVVSISFILSRVSTPGYHITISPLALAYYVPVILLAFPAWIGWNVMKGTEDFYPLASWLLAIALSALGGIILQSHVFIPYRHVQYIWTPISVFFGVGIAALRRYFPKISKREIIAKSFVFASLFLILFITAYPPQEALGGFQEGTKWKTVEGILWMKEHLPKGAIVLADHRVSDAIFGIGEINATWEYDVSVLLTKNVTKALIRLYMARTPIGWKRVSYVAFDNATIKGVAGVQWANAKPMSKEALEKFNTPYFQKIYDNGWFRVYKVNWKRAMPVVISALMHQRFPSLLKKASENKWHLFS